MHEELVAEALHRESELGPRALIPGLFDRSESFANGENELGKMSMIVRQRVDGISLGDGRGHVPLVRWRTRQGTRRAGDGPSRREGDYCEGADQAMARFGEGLKAITAVARTLA